MRPDPTLGNVVMAVSDASARQHTIGVNYQIGALPPLFLPSNAARVDWKRVFLIGQHTFGVWNNNSRGFVQPTSSGTSPPSGARTGRCQTSRIRDRGESDGEELQAQVEHVRPFMAYTILTGR